MGVTFEFIDAAESFAIFDAAAKREMGMPGVEFAKRWDRGDYAGLPENVEAMRVAMLRPDGYVPDPRYVLGPTRAEIDAMYADARESIRREAPAIVARIERSRRAR